jgi:predicted nucleotidyltransferase
MPDLAATSLTPDERALLERSALLLRERLGPALHAVWLFGSRARGEEPSHEDSDVDVLVLVDDDSWEGKDRVRRAFDEAARELGLEKLSVWFAVHVHTPEWLRGRRAIKSFFIAEVDRDKVVIEGSG